VIEEVVKRRREAAAPTKEEGEESKMNLTENKSHSNNPFTSPQMEDMLNKKKETEGFSDGILAIGRNAYREVLSGLSKGCDASLAVIEEVPAVEEEENQNKEENTESDYSTTNEEQVLITPIETTETSSNNETVMEPIQEEQVDYFSLPPKFSPVIYIPHVNIIGWSNIPYRLYMWYADYNRIDEVGKYAVAAVLNQTRPIEERDADLGQQEKKYWIGDETAEVLKQNDTPIVIDARIFDKLSTYTSDDLP
jgi:import inner membrane translocase subunit TIM54